MSYAFLGLALVVVVWVMPRIVRQPCPTCGQTSLFGLTGGVISRASRCRCPTCRSAL
jgi:transposase-like protein